MELDNEFRHVIGLLVKSSFPIFYFYLFILFIYASKYAIPFKPEDNMNRVN